MFEEEWNIGIKALIADVANPLVHHRSRTRTAFAADDDPMDAVEIEVANRAEERPEGEESHRCVGLLEMTEAR